MSSNSNGEVSPTSADAVSEGYRGCLTRVVPHVVEAWVGGEDASGLVHEIQVEPIHTERCGLEASAPPLLKGGRTQRYLHPPSGREKDVALEGDVGDFSDTVSRYHARLRGILEVNSEVMWPTRSVFGSGAFLSFIEEMVLITDPEVEEKREQAEGQVETRFRSLGDRFESVQGRIPRYVRMLSTKDYLTTLGKILTVSTIGGSYLTRAEDFYNQCMEADRLTMQDVETAEGRIMKTIAAVGYCSELALLRALPIALKATSHIAGLAFGVVSCVCYSGLVGSAKVGNHVCEAGQIICRDRDFVERVKGWAGRRSRRKEARRKAARRALDIEVAITERISELGSRLDADGAFVGREQDKRERIEANLGALGALVGRDLSKEYMVKGADGPYPSIVERAVARDFLMKKGMRAATSLRRLIISGGISEALAGIPQDEWTARIMKMAQDLVLLQLNGRAEYRDLMGNTGLLRAMRPKSFYLGSKGNVRSRNPFATSRLRFATLLNLALF